MSESIRMRLSDVAQTLQCSRDHVYHLNRQGRLRKYNDGPRYAYWLRTEVEAYARGEDPYAAQGEEQHGKEEA